MDSAVKMFAEGFDEVGVGELQRLFDGQSQEATDFDLALLKCENVSGGQAMYVAVDSAGGVGTPTSKQAVAYEVLVEFVGNLWDGAESLQGVAKAEAAGKFRIEKWTGSDEVAGTAELFFVGVPESEGKVAEQRWQRGFAETAPGVEEEFFIGGFGREVLAGFCETFTEFCASIEAHIA